MNRLSPRLFLHVVLALSTSVSNAATLNVPLVTQEHSQWCWAGSSQAILNFYNKLPSQCQIANFAFGINYACGNSDFYWYSAANQPNSMYGNSSSVQNILYNWGIPNVALNSYLPWANIVSDIDANRPFVIRYGWTAGGGHIMVGRGYETIAGVNYLYIMNPWPGEGMTYDTYNSTVYDYDHQWTHTQRITISG